MTRGRFLRLQTQEPSETAEKVVFQKKPKILGVLKCIIQQERGLRSDSRGPFFYDYIGVLKKVDFFSGLEPSLCLHLQLNINPRVVGNPFRPKKFTWNLANRGF